MTTEHAAPAAGFDTHAAVLRMKEAGVTEEQGVAMMYAAIAASNARAAEERAVAAAERREERAIAAAERREERAIATAERRALRRDLRALRRELRRDMKHMGTQIRLWIAGSVILCTGLAVGALRFLMEWPR